MAKIKKTPENVNPKLAESVEILFKDLREKAPKVFEAIKGEAVGVVTGAHLDSIKAILKALSYDVFDLQSKKITQEAFEAKLEERRAEIFGLFMTDTISRCKPSDQKILDSTARVLGTLRKAGGLL